MVSVHVYVFVDIDATVYKTCRAFATEQKRIGWKTLFCIFAGMGSVVESGNSILALCTNSISKDKSRLF